MSKYRLLDLFCGAGGAAVGYARAGFEVVGVDIEPQPHYPFDFVEYDAIELLGELTAEYPTSGSAAGFVLSDFDAIHASPPCQGYSILLNLPWLKDREYPLLIEPTRELLRKVEIPWVIENVMNAPLGIEYPGFVICGLAVGLESLSRHRRFEASFPMLVPPCPGHKTIQAGSASLGKRYRKSGGVTGVSSNGISAYLADGRTIAGHFTNLERAKAAMGIDWMDRDELTQAIPPAYTEFIGSQLIDQLDRQSLSRTS